MDKNGEKAAVFPQIEKRQEISRYNSFPLIWKVIIRPERAASRESAADLVSVAKPANPDA
jgi:hypothetical protein